MCILESQIQTESTLKSVNNCRNLFSSYGWMHKYFSASEISHKYAIEIELCF